MIPAAPEPAPAPLFDSHAHLTDSQFAADLAAVLERAARANVAEVLLPASDPEDARRALALAAEAAAPRLFASAGLHPHAASAWNAQAREGVEAALESGAVAIGETGLDYHYDHAPRPAQRRAFEEQAAIARARDLPLVVHAREADADVAAVLRASGLAAERVVLHSFSSGPELLRAALDEGWYVSFSGMLTFRRFDPALAAEVPAERLLVETDAPYLAPVPLRGRRNEPAFLPAVVARLAEIRGTDVAETGEITRANAKRVYKIEDRR